MSPRSSGDAPVVVIGAGISGLAAAHELLRNGVEVVVLEATHRAGGHIATSTFAGVDLDEGADAFLLRVPWALELCEELGLADDLVHPATGTAYVLIDGVLQRLPPSLLGVPTDLDHPALAAILSEQGLARARAEPQIPGEALTDDETIGAVIRRRLGDEVLERLVDPLVGGINAGNTDHLSIDAVTPQLATVARRSASILDAIAAIRRVHPPDSSAPVFGALPGGMGRLIAALADRLGERLRLDTFVSSIEVAPTGVLVETDRGPQDAAAVVMATPARTSSRLLTTQAPDAASALGAVASASVALVSLAYRVSDIAMPLDGSGFLVPRTEGRLVTACSWSSRKWAHLHPEQTGQNVVLLRVSVGRSDDERLTGLDDGALVAGIRTDLAMIMGIEAAPADVRIRRYIEALPQYEPGHLGHMAEIQEQLDEELPRVHLAGATLHGVGIPACIDSGRKAARAIIESA